MTLPIEIFNYYVRVCIKYNITGVLYFPDEMTKPSDPIVTISLVDRL